MWKGRREREREGGRENWEGGREDERKSNSVKFKKTLRFLKFQSLWDFVEMGY